MTDEKVRADFEAWWCDPNTNRRLTDMDEGRAIYIWKAAHARYALSADKIWAQIKHGNSEHQEWLKEALDCVFAGKPIPPVDASVKSQA